MSILPDQQQLADLEQLRGVDFLFISRPEEHELKIQGRFYNPWIDPYIELIKDHHSCLKAGFFTKAAAATSPRCVPTVHLKTDQSPFYYPLGENYVTNFEHLRKLVRSLCDVELDEAPVIEMANIIEQYRLYFLDLLSVLQPKAVPLVCWYGTPAMGLIWACRDLNITSVDLQHGYHTGHLFYEQWSSIPPEGYELLPDVFYVWSRTFKDGIENTHSDCCSRHFAVVGNHAWLRKVTQHEPSIDGIDQNFLQQLAQRPKVILVTLQPWIPLPDYLLDAIKRLPHDWLWLIRCHPGHEYMAKDVSELLRSRSISNYEIENATRYPLFKLLQYSHHHLTASSSSCLEALLFGVPTTFFSYEAYERYNEHIDKGFFNCVPSSADDLMRSLLRDYNRTTLKSLSQHFFDMDHHTGQRAWQDIFHHACKKPFQPLTCNLRALVNNWAGEQFFRIGDLEKALYCFWNAAKTDPNSTEYYNNCAAVCSHLGKAAHAANCIEKALQIDPDDPRTLRNLYELRNAGVNVDSHHATNDSLPDQCQCIKTL